MCPPSGVNLKALDNRFTITLSKLLRSIHAIIRFSPPVILNSMSLCCAVKSNDRHTRLTNSTMSVSWHLRCIWFLSIRLVSSIWFTSSNRRSALRLTMFTYWPIFFRVVSSHVFCTVSLIFSIGPRIIVSGERMSCVAFISSCIFSSSKAARCLLRTASMTSQTAIMVSMAYVSFAHVVAYHGGSTVTSKVDVSEDTSPPDIALTSMS